MTHQSSPLPQGGACLKRCWCHCRWTSCEDQVLVGVILGLEGRTSWERVSCPQLHAFWDGHPLPLVLQLLPSKLPLPPSEAPEHLLGRKPAPVMHTQVNAACEAQGLLRHLTAPQAYSHKVNRDLALKTHWETVGRSVGLQIHFQCM